MNAIFAEIITGLGIVLCMFCMFFMFAGTKIDNNSGFQEIEVKGVKIKTSSIISLLIISVVVTVLPFSLNEYVILKQKEMDDKIETKRMESAPKDVKAIMYVNGQVEDKDGRSISHANIKVIDTSTGSIIADDQSNEQGNFDIRLKLPPYQNRIKIVTQKNGYDQHTIILGTEVVQYPAILKTQQNGKGN